MIQNKKDLLYYLECDRIALQRKNTLWDKRSTIWRFQRLMRRCEYAKNTHKNALYRAWLRNRYTRMEIRLSYSIPLNVFGPGLAIIHRGDIVVSPGASIGANCRIHVGVNIEANAGASKAAIIGDNVYIGPGVKIIGNVHIADNVVIGANAVVVRDIMEPSITVGGVPAKKISQHDSSKHVIRATEMVCHH